MVAGSVDNVPIRWRLRPDLETSPSRLGMEPGWTIKDPLRATYFHLTNDEYRFLTMLDGATTLTQIRDQLSLNSDADDFSLQNMHVFLTSAIRSQILRATMPGMKGLHPGTARASTLGALLKIGGLLLSFRTRGIDPSRFLNALDRTVGWIFQPAAIVSLGLLLIYSISIFLSQWLAFKTEVLDPDILMTAQNLWVMAFALIIVKIVHEIGHGLTCRHYGGECHELGILFVAFLPLLYCNVSDSWLQQNRWKRMAVAAAGIGAELIIASVCTLLWASTRTGFLHTFCRNTMILCSINTLLVNGNPLLRYDSYYILSDLVHIPNLAARARDAALSFLDRLLLGLRPPPVVPMSAPAIVALGVYGVASVIYRLTLSVTLLYAVHRMLSAVGLESLVVLPAITIVAGVILGIWKYLQSRLLLLKFHPETQSRAAIGTSLFFIAVVLIGLVPLPMSVSVPFVMTPGKCRPIIAVEPGYVFPLVDEGATVHAGDLVLEMKNPELTMRFLRIQNELELAKIRLNTLQAQRSNMRSAASLLPTAQVIIDSKSEMLRQVSEQLLSLRISASTDGRVFPERHPLETHLGLRTSGVTVCDPLASRVRGQWVEKYTTLFWLGAPSDLRAQCLVDEFSVDLVRSGAAAELVFTSDPLNTISGHVELVEKSPETLLDRELALNRMVPVKNLYGTTAPDNVTAAQIVIDSPSALNTTLYLTGYATIQCEKTSLVSRLLRYVRYTFRMS